MFIILSSCSALFGQGAMNLVTDSVQIVDYVNKAESISFDADQSLGLSLIQSLENQSFGALRSGGPSVLSTILHRGMASRHIAILWGGFNIQSVVNGTFDLGLIRSTFDQAKYYRSGVSATSGNASMAGAFSLGNSVFKENSTSVNLSMSSAKNVGITAMNKLKSDRYFHHIAVNYTSDQNAYTYKNQGVKVTQQFAEFSIFDLNYQGALAVSERLSLTGGLWLQKAERNIPPTKTSVQIQQTQEDENYRGFLRLDYYVFERGKLSLRSGYFNESIKYEAPGISSLSTVNSYNFALDFIHDSGLSLSGQFRQDNVEASFFVPLHRRTTSAFLADYKLEWKDWSLGASIRPEWVDNNVQPVIIGLRLNKNITKNLTSTFIYNKGYTLPSFNDLYWPAGGNPELRTERSHEIDLGFDWHSRSNLNDGIKLNLFYNLIDDWIQWTPVDGIFQPVNQRKVRNLGLEFSISKEFNLKQNNRISANLMYSFTDSRLVKHYIDPTNEGKRTIFVPTHKITGKLSYIRKTWQVSFQPIYYSKRYDTVDNSTFTPGYFLTNLQFFKSIKVSQNHLTFSLAVENGLNNDYENIRFYPMPLRLFRIGINFKF